MVLRWWRSFRDGCGSLTRCFLYFLGVSIIEQWLPGVVMIAVGLLQAAFYERIRWAENSRTMPPWFRRLTELSNRSRPFFCTHEVRPLVGCRAAVDCLANPKLRVAEVNCLIPKKAPRANA